MTLNIIDRQAYRILERILGYLEEHDEMLKELTGLQSDDRVEAIIYLRAMLGK